jgi:hypothetical protein
LKEVKTRNPFSIENIVNPVGNPAYLTLYAAQGSPVAERMVAVRRQWEEGEVLKGEGHYVQAI